MRIDLDEHIVVESGICHGKPTFKGTRVMVWQVLEMLEGGLTAKDIIRDHPSLTRRCCLSGYGINIDFHKHINIFIFKSPQRQGSAPQPFLF